MPQRQEHWFRQAQKHLGHNRHALEAGDCEWACYAAQQATEKVVKAVLAKRHGNRWDHSITALLSQLPEDSKPPADLIDRAKELDKHHIATRYPNGFDVGAPTDHYIADKAKRAIENATRILAFCESHLRRSAESARRISRPRSTNAEEATSSTQSRTFRLLRNGSVRTNM